MTMPGRNLILASSYRWIWAVDNTIAPLLVVVEGQRPQVVAVREIS